MKSPSKKKLEVFSKEEHRKHKIQATVESIVAVAPLMAFGFGIAKLSSTPQGIERMAPAQFGFIHVLILLVSMSYIIFLFFIIKDIKKRLAIR